MTTSHPNNQKWCRYCGRPEVASDSIYCSRECYFAQREEYVSYKPTPKEIQQKCLEIQVGWTRQQREKRMVSKDQRWSPPVVEVYDDMDDDMDFDDIYNEQGLAWK